MFSVMKTAVGYGSTLFSIISLTVVLAVVQAFAGTAVSARYLQPRGKHIVWVISIPDPSPEVVIVTQHIPPGSEITESSHPLSSYDKKNGVAKWLLSSVPSGSLEMEMKINSFIREKGEIHGEVLFKDFRSSTTFSIFQKPPITKKALEGC